MANIDFSFNDDELHRIKERISKLSFGERQGVIDAGLKNIAILTHQRLVANVSNRILRRRTGTLAKSMQWRVVDTNDGKAAFIGANVLSGKRLVYANILERGGIIRPKRRKYLAIPLKAALTSSGASKRPGPRDWQNTFVRKTRSGNLVIFHSAGRRILPIYILKKQVKIKPFRYLATTLSQVRGRIFQIMNATISRELRK